MKNAKGTLLMASAACAWGFSYIFMKLGLGSLTPYQLIFLRFGIAFPLLLLVFNKKLRPNKSEVKYSIILGAFVFLLSAFYNYGLITTDASTAGFLAGTTVVLVPIINAVIKRRVPARRTIVATALSLTGVGAMSITTGLSISLGTLLCMAGATAYAFQIIITDRALANCRSLVIGVWQMAFAAVFGGIAMSIQGETAISLDPTGWAAILGLALLCSAYGYVAQTMAQKDVPPERIGFIYALEPVFCAVLAFIFFQEIMTLREALGAILIIISIII